MKEPLILRLTEVTTKNKFVTIAIMTLLFIVLALGMKNLVLNTNYKVFFGKQNPMLQEFNQFVATYGNSDNLVIVIKPKNGDVFNKEVLGVVEEITNEMWTTPYSSRVDSITNYQYSRSANDELIVEPILNKSASKLNQGEVGVIKQRVMGENLLMGRLISADGKTTGINVNYNFSQTDRHAVEEIVNDVNKKLEPIKSKYADMDIVVSGQVMLNYSFAEATMTDIERLVPVMVVGIIIVMLFMLRSVTGSLAALTIVLFSCASAVGIIGWLGLELTPPSACAPTIILTIAIADSVHIIATMFGYMRKGLSKKEALYKSVSVNIRPMIITALTTLAGFLSLNFSDSPPFADMGNIAALGVAIALFYSIVLLPSLLMVLPINPPKINEKGDHYLADKIGAAIINNRRLVMIALLAFSTIASLGMAKINCDDNFVEYFGKSLQFRQDAEFLMDNLTGMYFADFSIAAKNEDGIHDKEYLANLDKFKSWLEQQPEVAQVSSIVDIYKKLNMNMHGDDPRYYKLPESRELASQYMFLYEMSLPFGLEMGDKINVNKSASRVNVIFKKDVKAVAIREFRERSTLWLQNNTPNYMHSSAISPSVMFSYIAKRNIDSMINGNIASFLLISMFIGIAMKNMKIGFISLIPNVLPIAITFGIWGWGVGEVNMAVSVISSMSLGILVDDTIHFLSKYDMARKEGKSPEEAARYSFKEMAAVMLTTSVILTAGFLIMAMSTFQVNQILGMLTAIAIVTALIFDCLMVPVALVMFDRRKQNKTTNINNQLLLNGVQNA